MRTSNPVLSQSAFSRAPAYGAEGTMTVQGTVNKSFILFFLLLISATWIWNKFLTAAYSPEMLASAVAPFMMAGAILGFILALVTIFKKPWAGFTAPAYALCEGLFLGGISVIFEMRYPGIVIQAVALTFATLFCMLFVYKSGLIKVNRTFMLGVVSATGAVALVYLVSWILSFFGTGVPFIYGSGPVGILFSFVVVGIAALNLVLDFHIIETSAQEGAPAYMEWYGAFALMVTLVWLYIEILRLLAKMRSRR